MPELSVLGWDAVWAAHLGDLGAVDCVAGRVALEHNHVFRVLTESGEWLAEVAGTLKHRASGRHELPAVGDWVAVRPDDRGGRALIRGVLPRRSVFSRRAAGRETNEQIVAANIDTVLIVFGLDQAVNPRGLERYLTVAHRGGAAPVIVLNKADLVENPEHARAEAQAVVGGTPVLLTSARQGQGLDEVRALSGPGLTMALLGPSGAGKSSLVNCLVGREVLPTGEVRAWDGRGRHTSVHRELVMCEHGGLVIDTPGMRELQLWDTDVKVEESFADIASWSGACRFRDCQHDREPGCAVKAAAERGELEAGRYASFLKLNREQRDLEAKREERKQLEVKRAGRIMGKALKAMQKERDR